MRMRLLRRRGSRRHGTGRALVSGQTIPDDDGHAQQPADDAEDQGHDAAGREAGGQRLGRDGLAGEVEQVGGVAGRVAGGGDAESRAGVEVVLGDLVLEGGLDVERGLDEGRC